jgi:translation initiation factor 4B
MGARRGDRPGFGRQESEAGGGGGGFDSMVDRSAFGAKFTPAPAGVLQQPARRMGPGPESLEPSQGDNASDWRTGKPTTQLMSSTSSRQTSGSPAGPIDGAAPVRGPMRSGPRGDATEVDEKYASQERLGFGSKFVATPPESPSMAKRPGFGFADRRGSNAPSGPSGAPPASSGPSEDADTWRSAARKPSIPTVSEGNSPAQAAPAQRKKLELKPRTVPAAGSEGYDANAVATPTSATGRANPFGSAKPVDAGEREREIEAKLAAQDKERKEAEKKRREDDKKRKDKIREKAPPHAPTGPKADRNKSRGATSEKGSETSSTPAADKEADQSSSAAGTPSASTTSLSNGPKPAPPTGAWGKGRKPSGALVSGEQSPEVQAAATVNGNATGESNSNGKHGVEAAEVSKAVESLSVSQD